MKRIYATTGFIIITALICITSNLQVDKKVSLMKQELERVNVAVFQENTAKTKEVIAAADETKTKVETTLSFFVDADKIESFNISFALLKAHLEDGNMEHALESLHECEFMLDEILKNEKISIENVM